MIYEEEHTVRLTVDQITMLISALALYEADVKKRGLTHTAKEVDGMIRSFLKVNCNAYGLEDNTVLLNAKEIEVK